MHVDDVLMQFGVQPELHMAVCFIWQSQVRAEKGAQLPLENAGEDGGTGWGKESAIWVMIDQDRVCLISGAIVRTCMTSVHKPAKPLRAKRMFEDLIQACFRGLERSEWTSRIISLSSAGDRGHVRSKHYRLAGKQAHVCVRWLVAAGAQCCEIKPELWWIIFLGVENIHVSCQTTCSKSLGIIRLIIKLWIFTDTVEKNCLTNFNL